MIRNGKRAVFDLFSNSKWVRFFRFFGWASEAREKAEQTLKREHASTYELKHPLSGARVWLRCWPRH